MMVGLSRKIKLFIALVIALVGIAFFWASGKQKIIDGVSYEYLNSFRGEPLSIHVVEVDPTKVNIIPEMGAGIKFGIADVSSMAERREAVVGINAGFFHFDGKLVGVPAGLLKIKNQWYSDSAKYRAAIGWSQNGEHVVIDRLILNCSAKIGEKEVKISRLNQKRLDGYIVVYTDAFGEKTLTTNKGSEIIIKNGRISEIKLGQGNSPIPLNGQIISVDAKSKLDLSDIKIDMPVEISYSFDCSKAVFPKNDEPAWQKCDYVVGGTPVLIADRNIVYDFSPEKDCDSFVHKKHPRTAIGILPNKHWLFVVIDGYQSSISEGMTLHELADFMYKLGCVSALNMDGGSSSVMFVKDKIINVPAKKFGVLVIKGEKPVSDSILVLPR